ncbi:MAG: hypothetical protein SGJ27_24725 [Candidatus Melainabacteria bacterium]|nr:hypothetical protein [Candidatus Melainabacteria bacterium]
MNALATAPKFPAITAAYGSSTPGSTKGMMLVRGEFGHSTEHVDYADMEVWFSANHPEVFTTDGGKRTFDLERVTETMLKAYFAHDRSNKPLPKGFELGCMVDTTKHPYFSYARNFTGWAPAIAAGVTDVDGHVRIETIPVK